MSAHPPRRGVRFMHITDLAGPAWRGRSGSSTGRVGWRMIAANNRPLGRSMQTFATFEASVESALVLHQRVDEVSSSALFDATRGVWSWTVLLDGSPVAASVNTYNRRIECLRALRQFLEAVAGAEPVADEVRNLGPNALRGYEPSNASPEPRTTWNGPMLRFATS